MSVLAFLPDLPARRQVHTTEPRIVEPVEVAIVHDAVVEVRLDGLRSPENLDVPVVALPGDMEPPRALIAADTGSNQDIRISDQGRLNNAVHSFFEPVVFPEKLAV